MNVDARTSKQAARSGWVVRLVSFGAATLLIALLLIAAAMMRYGLEREATPAEAVMVSEVARAPEPQRAPAPTPRRVVESGEAPTPVAAPTPIAQDIEPLLITQPVWIQRPRNTVRYYPREAFMQGVDGQVVLDCFVEVDGRLTCSVVSETPPDRGFGAAALAIAAAHVMQPAMRDGLPVRARYRMRVPFSASG